MINRRVCNLLWRYRNIRFSSSAAESIQQIKPRISQNETWVKIKDSVHKMCAEPSTNAQTFSLLEEIGYAHLNDEKPETKFLLNTDHVVLAVRTILDSKQFEEPVEIAKQFVIALVDLKLAKLDDAWIRVIVRAELERYPTKPLNALETYKNICKLQPFPKLFPGSMFLILQVLYGDNTRTGKKVFNKALDVVEGQASKVPRYCMEGAVLMINGRALEFLDRLKNNERSLGIDEVRYLCFLAMALKEPKILEPLVQLDKILPESRSARLELYNTLALLYGQAKDLYGIDVLWSSLDKMMNLDELHYYRHVLQRCRHFFRCNNRKIPDQLTDLLQKLGDLK